MGCRLKRSVVEIADERDRSHRRSPCEPEEVVGWDIANWSRAVQFWSTAIHRLQPGARCLELGCGDISSLALWLAMRGHNVVCTDVGGVAERIMRTHERFGVARQITYADVDARSIAYVEEYDVVAFKSILGGIVGSGPLAIARDVVERVHAALKPGGLLLFAENLMSTPVHQLCRAYFGAGKHSWHYFTTAEIREITTPFAAKQTETFGFLGCFGRSERQRTLLGNLDRAVCEALIPRAWHYIAAVVAQRAT